MGDEAETYRVWRRCPTCTGNRVVDVPHCQLCGLRLDAHDPWWETEQLLLPCGHEAASNLREEIRCPDCAGTGKMLQVVSPAEWHALARRRLWRSILLVLLAMIPLVVLLLAVAEQEGALTCGNWWYGVVLLVLAGRW
jgi:hypothetical protein